MTVSHSFFIKSTIFVLDWKMLMEYLSKQRYDEIAAELDHLINEVYPE